MFFTKTQALCCWTVSAFSKILMSERRECAPNPCFPMQGVVATALVRPALNGGCSVIDTGVPAATAAA